MTFGKKIIPTRGNASSKHDPVKGFREKKKGFKPLNGLGNHTGKKKYTRSLDTETIIFSSKQIHIVRMLCNSADGHMRASVTCAPSNQSLPPTTLTTQTCCVCIPFCQNYFFHCGQLSCNSLATQVTVITKVS